MDLKREKQTNGAARSAGQGGNGGARRYTVSFTLFHLVSGLAVLFCALVWFFIFGVIVGRGYWPEEAVPQLTRIMPQGEAGQQAADSEGEVLRPEDLKFYEDLKQGETRGYEPAPPAPKTVQAPKKAPAQAVQEALASAKQQAGQEQLAPAAASTAAAQPAPKPQVKTTPAPAPKAAPKAQAAADQPDDPEDRVYDYIYQTASFRDYAMAEDFRRQLSARGVKAQIEAITVKGTAWHRVLAHFTGTPVETRELKATLGELGVDKPLLKSKKPTR